MARAKRSLKRRQFRFSLDPMDPVEGEALRQINKIAEEAKELFEEISEDEADRYAFKRVLLGLLKERPLELQMHPSAFHEATAAPAPPQAPEVAPPYVNENAQLTPAPATAMSSQVAQPLTEASPTPASQPIEQPQASELSSPAHSLDVESSKPSWQEQLIGSGTAAQPGKGVRHPVAASLAWSESKSEGSEK